MVASKLLPLAALLSAAAALPAADSAQALTQYAGVNIAGFDFGCSTDGSCNTASALPPLGGNAPDGIGQMKHFVQDRGLNIFRLPVGWQYITNNNGDYSTLDGNNAGKYDQLVQGCLQTGAKCIIDIHNYARYNGKIIDQTSGAPTAAQFAKLWTNIATKYRGNSNVIFGVMNEPHDLDINHWGQTVQTVVTAIRKATGNNNNLILLPGTAYTAGTQYINDGSFDALSKVTNADGSKTNLIFDIHNYLDSDNSGTHTNCVTNNVQGLTPLQQRLASTGRQAILSETGGGPNDSSCFTNVCAELNFLNQNSGQFIGYTGWSAGSFDSTYELTLTPTYSNGRWTDVQLMTKCFARK